MTPIENEPAAEPAVNVDSSGIDRGNEASAAEAVETPPVVEDQVETPADDPSPPLVPPTEEPPPFAGDQPLEAPATIGTTPLSEASVEIQKRVADINDLGEIPVAPVGTADPNADTQLNTTLKITPETGSAGGDGGLDAGGQQLLQGDQLAQPAIVQVPAQFIGDKVWVRIGHEGRFETSAIVTRVFDDGTLNLTAFPDGEVPRPLSRVPYDKNGLDATIAWAE